MKSEYRVVRKTEETPDYIDHHFLVCKVFYNDDGSIKFIDTAECIKGRSVTSAMSVYERMATAFYKPVLDYETSKEISGEFD